MSTAKLDILLGEGEVVADAVGFASLHDRHIVVSGASGLIGSTMLASLAVVRQRGVPFDLTLLLRSEPQGELADLARSSGARIVQADLSEPGISLGPGADMIIHAAGASAPLQFMTRPLETLAIGACGTLRLIKSLAPGGRLLFVSSTEVYSGFEGGLARESDIGTTTPSHPRASYIEAKRAGETACVSARVEGIDAVAVRVGMTFGPGTRAGDTRVINRLIEQALTSGRVELLDSGDAVRSLAYVTDTVELMWRAALEGKEAIYNISGPALTTIRELGRTICDLTGAELVVPESAAGVPGAPAAVRVDASRATQEFGKRAWVSVDQGLLRTLAWQRLLYPTGARR